MNSGIYQITCLTTSKMYIGSTINFDTRFKTHKNTLKNNKHRNPYLQAAFNKYGESNFKYEIVEYCEKQYLRMTEQLWMDKTQCYLREKGFNNCKLSDRPLGYKHTEASKKIMSEKKKGVKQKPETIIKRTESLKGRKCSEETKEKIRFGKLGNKNPMYGVRYTDEQKAIKVEKLLSVPRWNKGKNKDTDPIVAKLSEKLKGRQAINKLKCKLINKVSQEEWKGDSLQDLAAKCPISLASLNRLRANKVGSKSSLLTYSLEVINEC